MQDRLNRAPMDMPFLMLVLLLLGIGLIMMFSASYATAFYDSSAAVGNDPLYYIRRQAAYSVIGLVGMYIISRINYEHLRVLSIPLLVGSIILLVLVLIFGFGGDTVGAQRWMKLLILAGPSYQPSEVAKIAVIIFFSARLSKREFERKKHFSKRTTRGRVGNFLERIGFLELLPYAAIIIVIEFLLYKEPHMSGMILVLVGAASVLLVSGISLKWFIGVGSLAVAGLLGIIMFTPYMRRRIELWLNPWADPLHDGYQTIQSMLAMASGGVLGLGFGNSRQKMLYIPEPQNDFVYPIVVEELGMVGGLIVMLLFALLICRGYTIALHARDKFGSMLTVGIITLLAVQVFLNIGVVTNLIPNTGISLPFFSFGGTALCIQMAAMGIVLAVSRQALPPPKKKKVPRKDPAR